MVRPLKRGGGRVDRGSVKRLSHVVAAVVVVLVFVGRAGADDGGAEVRARRLFAEAVADAPPLPCQPTLQVEPIERSYTTWDCQIHLSADDLDVDDMGWWAPWAVRHELAHAIVSDGHGGHGPAFRAVLAGLLAPLGLFEVYAEPSSEYPIELWRGGVDLLAAG